MREHRTPRRALFTPHRVAGGPSVEDCSNTKRITRGVYIRDGKEFELIDDYGIEEAAHKVWAYWNNQSRTSTSKLSWTRRAR